MKDVYRETIFSKWWFGHVERRPINAVVRRVDQMEESQVKRGRGRPKKTIREIIRKDLVG